MPRYIYQCKKCEEVFQVVHSISEKLQDCADCKEACSLSGSLRRVPSMPLVITKIDRKKKPGSVVNKFIEETREELRQEKESLTGKELKT